MADLKEELALKAEETKGETKLTKSMSITDMIKAMQPEIKKALPSVITPERFTRMVSMTVLKCKKKAFEFCKFFDAS